jgi:hypothetical protein
VLPKKSGKKIDLEGDLLPISAFPFRPRGNETWDNLNDDGEKDYLQFQGTGHNDLILQIS